MKKFFSAITMTLLTSALLVSQTTVAQAEGDAPRVQVKAEQDLVDLPFDINLYPENYVDLNSKGEGLDSEEQGLLDSKGKDKAWIQYSNLDAMGRGQEGHALITYNTVLTRSAAYMKKNGILYGDKKIFKRPGFPSYVHVAGEYADGVFDKSKQRWKGTKKNNEQVTFKTGKGGAFYNKSHTIAWSLGGDMETHNVTLGTRAQNVGSGNKGGMAYAEHMVRDTVNAQQETKIYYHVEPMYKGSELVPRGSRVRAYSVNDNGKTVNLDIWVFNTQDGFLVDYLTGAFSEAS